MEQILEQQKVKTKEIPVTIQNINIVTSKFKIVGTSPLLMDKFPEDVKKEIEDKQSGKSQVKKKIRDIDKEQEQAIHKLPNGNVGFPASGFKAGLIEATSFVGDKFFSKKLLKGIQIVNDVNGLIPIEYKKQDICVHSIQSNTKHTPQFNDWSCVLTIQFDRNNISQEDLATLINYAGFYYGIGIWSPRCKSGGKYGMYKLA
jgi:hypothetical protein